MKQLGIYILILLHLNVALFPQLDEVDVYDVKTGRQIEDINTVFEWFGVSLGYDTDADDEDDDNGDERQIIKTVSFICAKITNFNDFITQQIIFFACENKYFEFISPKIYAISFEIVAPPPEV
jgi:hypothetical protein